MAHASQRVQELKEIWLHHLHEPLTGPARFKRCFSRLYRFHTLLSVGGKLLSHRSDRGIKDGMDFLHLHWLPMVGSSFPRPHTLYFMVMSILVFGSGFIFSIRLAAYFERLKFYC
jgi:hypothetical protein